MGTFAPKIVQNPYINQNLAKISLKTPKNSRLSLKILNFSKFSAPSAPKIWSFMSQKFGVLCPKGSPPGRGVPPKKYSDLYSSQDELFKIKITQNSISSNYLLNAIYFKNF